MAASWVARIQVISLPESQDESHNKGCSLLVALLPDSIAIGIAMRTYATTLGLSQLEQLLRQVICCRGRGHNASESEHIGASASSQCGFRDMIKTLRQCRLKQLPASSQRYRPAAALRKVLPGLTNALT